LTVRRMSMSPSGRQGCTRGLLRDQERSQKCLPLRSRLTQLFDIEMAIVDFRDRAHHAVGLIADTAELVIEHFLDYVRRNSEAREAGPERPTDVMKDPAGDTAGGVEDHLRLRPCIEYRRWLSSHVLAARGEKVVALVGDRLGSFQPRR